MLSKIVPKIQKTAELVQSNVSSSQDLVQKASGMSSDADQLLGAISKFNMEELGSELSPVAGEA
jgi:hypothetical protein